MTRRDSVNSPEKVAARAVAAAQARRGESAALRRSAARQQPVWTVGQHVCIEGVGTAAPVHEHHTVTRLTKAYVYSAKLGATQERRHRLDNGKSAHGYGYTTVNATCQRPKT